jgi:hypothetical protein
MDLRTAEGFVDEVWNVQTEELEVLDCRITGRGRQCALRVTTDSPTGPRVRLLRTVEVVELFLNPAEMFEEVMPGEIESWDADMGL